ncbi:hypothetical protein AB1Y20_013807 [Prymnesium parvum]|uniref:Calmodulin n=1 Tax=Prymnesium parvum TaxID=97485 RepID=A0AB34IHH9_PRYPA
MGCGASRRGTIDKSLLCAPHETMSGNKAKEKTARRRVSSMTQMERDSTNRRAVEAFHNIDTSRDGFVTSDELRKLFPTMEPALFEGFFHMLAKDKKGRVSQKEFLMSIALLTRACSAPVQQIDACFSMFDKDNTGTLSREEFAQLIKVSVNLNLASVLSTKEGQQRMEEQLAKEYSEENINFWKAVQSYRELGPAERAAEAKVIINTYVKNGAECQVNLPAELVSRTLADVDATQDEPAADVFDEAQTEIFKLMERDTFSRFRADNAMVENLANDFFTRVDLNHSGRVSYDEFRLWALNEPIALVFFNGLIEASKKVVSQLDDGPNAELPAAAAVASTAVGPAAVDAAASPPAQPPAEAPAQTHTTAPVPSPFASPAATSASPARKPTAELILEPVVPP